MKAFKLYYFYPYLLGIILFSGSVISQTTLTQTRHYTWPISNPTSYDSVLSGLEGIRAVSVGDVNNDGKSEIVVTNYADLGHVHIFSPAGKDTFELVWSSPRVEANGGSSSPRNVLIGDMDKDGNKEIIFESRGNGVYIYEWDGKPGYNFGTKPSQLINPTNCPGFPITTGSSYVEKMSVSDVDNDGQQELVFAFRSALQTEQKYMIIKAVGEWSTDDQGFSSFDMPFMAARPNLATWGFNTGGSIGMMPANLDGTGAKEIVMQVYNNNNITILRNVGGIWQLADTANGKQNLNLTPNDGVSFFGGLVCDIDNDGRDEVYLPTNVYTSPDPAAMVRAVYYDSPSTPNEIDSNTNVFKIDFSNLVDNEGLWGYGYGDIDGNGKRNIYFSTAKLGAAIVTAEFQGGNKNNPLNWVTSVLWKGDSTYHSLSIKDSLGKVDTISYTIEFLFPSKIFAEITDLDKNGREDIITGYQPWYFGAGTTGTVGITKYTWNTVGNKFDTTNYSVKNPTRLGFAVLEKSISTGIEGRSLTFITPDDYILHQNYPNPFNPTTNINFVLPLNKKISIMIYDMIGKEVQTLISNQEYSKGNHTITWNGKDINGRRVASGVYIAKMNAGNVDKNIKMMLVK
jgi:hypothetical protein